MGNKLVDVAPDWVYSLPGINAGLNALATLLLVTGLVLIKRGRRDAHKTVMLTSFVVSVLFLGCYLTYHIALRHYTGASSRPFQGQGAIKLVYFTILITHVVLAAIVPILAILTIRRGLKAEWERHKKLARITFPIWLYVSITGVIIYLMLYQLPVG